MGQLQSFFINCATNSATWSAVSAAKAVEFTNEGNTPLAVVFGACAVVLPLAVALKKTVQGSDSQGSQSIEDGPTYQG